MNDSVRKVYEQLGGIAEILEVLSDSSMKDGSGHADMFSFLADSIYRLMDDLEQAVSEKKEGEKE